MNFLDLNSYMTDFIFDYISNVKYVGQNKLNFRCPLCGDGKKSTSHRGWFYIDTGSYFCWNAGCIANESGLSGLKFLSLISGKSITEVRRDLISRASKFNSPIIKNNKQEKFSLFDDEDTEIVKKHQYIIEKIELGEWDETLPKFVLEYINKRKLLIAPFLPKTFKFYFNKRLKRLVIPWNDTYYQERQILNSKSNEMKYLFPKGVEKPIFGIDNIDKNFKYIFILEGVFDSIWVKNGVAAGSLTLSNHQKQLLKSYKDDGFRIIYMPDNQYQDKSSYDKTLSICVKNPYEEIFIWPKILNKFKDINESIIFNDKFIELWKNENFLKNNIFNGVRAKLQLM